MSHRVVVQSPPPPVVAGQFTFAAPFTGAGGVKTTPWAHGVPFTINAPPGTFPSPPTGTQFEWLYDTVDKQLLNGVNQNAYAGFTNGQTIPHGPWQNLSQDAADGDTQTYQTAAPALRTIYNTAGYGTLNMNSNGKGYVGNPTWPVAFGTQANKSLYCSVWMMSVNAYGSAGGGGPITKVIRMDTQPNTGLGGNNYSATGPCPLGSAAGIGWQSNRTTSDGSFQNTRTGNAGVWRRFQYWIEAQNGGSQWSSGGNVINAWLGNQGSGNNKFYLCTNSAYGTGSFEICHAADKMYATLAPTNSFFDASSLFTNLTLSVIGFDDGGGNSTGNTLYIGEVALQLGLSRVETHDSPWDQSPTSSMNSEYCFVQWLSSSQISVTPNWGQFGTGKNINLSLANTADRHSATLMGTGS